MKNASVALLAALAWATPAFAAEPEKAPAPKEAKELVTSKDQAPAKAPGETAAFTIKVDTSEVPEMEAYGKQVQKVAEEWYPKLIPMLPSDGFTPAQTVTITFRKDDKGVAYASGNRIVASDAWFKKNPKDLGAFVHELVHVVQAYPRGRRPGWLVEGIADYIRFFQYEPESARPKPNPARAKHTDSYRTTGHFLNWAQAKYDKDLVVKLNAAFRQAKYTEDLWKQYTGKTLDELGAEWKASLAQAK